MTAQSKKTFEVGSIGVRVRSEATVQGTEIRWLPAGQLVEVDAASRTEADGYVWWKHAEGWSAERNLSGSQVYMIEKAVSAPAKPAQPSAPAEPAQPSAPAPSSQKKKFQVGGMGVRVRTEPSLQGAEVRWLPAGQELEVDAGSRTEAAGYIWWKHAEGWSAERSVSGKEIYLFAPGQAAAAAATPSAPVDASAPATVEGLPGGEDLPLRDQVFKRLPVDLNNIHWWQYFGNNVFAYDLWKEGKQWYKYAQGLHGGLDFGNSQTSGVKIYAGVDGQFVKRDTTYYQPNGLWVKVGSYEIIYGHLTNVGSFQPGQAIKPDTVMGEIQVGGQNHLHLEVRYKGTYVVNPLLLMLEDMRATLFGKFPPSAEYFYKGGGWTKWQTPLDQPVLVLGGALLGPHAG